MATKTALFVIDIQNDLATNPKARIPHADRIVEAGGTILSAARRILDSHQQATESPADPPAILVFVQHHEKPEEGPLVRGSEAWKLVFAPRPGLHWERLVEKTTRDTFESNPELAATLKASEVREIIAFGIQSECCVESTCSGALAAGFKVTLLSGAHSTYDMGGTRAIEVEKQVELRLQSKGARIVKWEEAVAQWGRIGRLSCE